MAQGYLVYSWWHQNHTWKPSNVVISEFTSCGLNEPTSTTATGSWFLEIITLEDLFFHPCTIWSSSTWTNMKLLTSSFSTSFTTSKFQFKPHLPNLTQFRTNKLSSCGVSSSIISPPPPDFDFRTQILGDSRAAIAETQPELLDLADNGSLVLITKNQYGPVPPWRTEFVEPDAIWLIGTTHTSQDSAIDVERVIRAVRPDNVVVELCRSRRVFFF